MISLSKDFKMVGLSEKTVHVQIEQSLYNRIMESGYKQYIQAIESNNVPYMNGVQVRIKRYDFASLMYGLLD